MIYLLGTVGNTVVATAERDNELCVDPRWYFRQSFTSDTIMSLRRILRAIIHNHQGFQLTILFNKIGFPPALETLPTPLGPSVCQRGRERRRFGVGSDD